MEESILNNLKNAENSIEDLLYLSPKDVFPIIDRLQFHISKVKEEASINKALDLNDFKGLLSFFSKGLENLIKEHLYRTDRVLKLNLSLEKFDYSLNRCNKVLEILPTVLKFIDLIGLEKVLNINIEGDFFNVSGKINTLVNQKENKNALINLNNELLDKKILTTFRLHKNETSNDLELKFDLSHEKDKIYSVNFSKNTKTKVTFPGIILNYRINQSFLFQLPEHIVLFFKDTFEVEHFSRPPKTLINYEDYEIYHFHFLFHPISFIIPREGVMLEDACFNQKNTGSGNGRFSDFMENSFQKNKPVFVDIFDLLKIK